MSEITHEGARSISSFGKKYGLGASTVYGEINAGRLKAAKVGRRTLIFDDAEREWRENLPKFRSDQSEE